MVEETIKKAISEAVGIDVSEIEISVPPVSEHGDYTSNVAMQLFAKLQETKSKKQTKSDSQNSKFKSPRELAEELSQKLLEDKQVTQIASDIKVEGPGFINFFLKTDYLVKAMQDVLDKKEEYGKSDKNKGTKVMVEFAHPNTHKAFHIGHLRNIVTGESLVRILEAMGTEVVRANYQGDVGMHIAKAIWGYMHSDQDDPNSVAERAEFLGKVYAKGATAYEENEESKAEIQAINKKIYSKEDEEINEIYKKTRQWSLDYFESIYKRVYAHFDRLYFESECYESGKKYALEALEKGIFEKSDGAIIFPGSKYGLHERVFISGEGVPTYEAKDLGLVKLQMSEYSPSRILHIVGPEQSEYFKVIFKAQELLFPETKGKQFHIPYGWVKLKEGKMSSRTGQVVLGESLLGEAKKKIQDQFKSDEEISEEVAVGAIKYSFLRVGRSQEIAFDMDEATSLDGNSGPYIQYAYARCQSVLDKGGHDGVFEIQNSKLKIESEESELLRSFIHYPEVVLDAAETYSPNLICNYIFDLAQKYNSFYNKCKIIGDERESFRLALTATTAQILKNGLELLGIKAPEKM